jgi:hypothetical protein
MKRVPKYLTLAKSTAVDPVPQQLQADLRSLIQSARSGVAQADPWTFSKAIDVQAGPGKDR